MSQPHSVQAAASLLQMPADELAEALERARVVGILIDYAKKNCGPVGASLEISISGNGESWGIYLNGVSMAGYRKPSFDEACAAAAKAIESGEIK